MTSSETVVTPHSTPGSKSRSERRVTWVVAGRGDVLLLGSLFQDFKKRHERVVPHWLLDTGEVGLAAFQARDALGLHPDETGDLSHPADEPAIRLTLMIERVESFIRRHKGTHAVFTGFGPTAAATAIYCHARGCKGLWLRPPDPAGLLGRLRWEAGLERIMRACAPCVEVWQIPAVPAWGHLLDAGAAWVPEDEIPGLRSGAPLVLIAVLRRDWGYLDDATSRLARAAAGWAAARPETDFLIVSNLNARIEGPVRSLAERPANLVLAPPLPYALYRAVLGRTRGVLTDSPLIAAEALAGGVPVATLGETAPSPAAPAPTGHRALVPGDLDGEAWRAELGAYLDTPPSAPIPSLDAAAGGDVQAAMGQAIEQWLQ